MGATLAVVVDDDESVVVLLSFGRFVEGASGSSSSRRLIPHPLFF